MPKVSIIITNYNGKKYLENCISSLKQGVFQNFEIIIVDNGSSDGSIGFLKEKYPDIKLMDLGANFGLAIASNKGRELASGEYLFFYNNDTIADKHMLSELVKVMDADRHIGICGCKTMTYDGKRETNCGVQLDIFGYPYGKGESFYVDAAIFIRKDVFNEIGGFDPKLFLYCEDKDLCWRVQLYGYKVVAVSKAIFWHDSFCAIDSKGNLTTNIKKRFMGEAFTLRMLLKNYSLFSLLKILPVYSFVNLAEIILFTLTGKLKIVFEVYAKAYFWNIANFSDTMNLRKQIQKQRKVNDKVIQARMYRGSGKLKLFRTVGVPRFSG